MKAWRVQISSEARSDIRGISDYITLELSAPESAKRVVSRLLKASAALSAFPERHPLYRRFRLSDLGLRMVPVDSFCVFYALDERARLVSIVRILYGGRDISSTLDSDA